MNRILLAIDQQSSVTPLGVPDLIFKDFRSGDPLLRRSPDKFSIQPLRLITDNGLSKQWSLAGKRVLLAPACLLTQKLLSDPEIQRADWIGLVDRNPIQHGKTVEGRSIYSYEAIPSLNVNVILVVAPEKHRLDILNAITSNTPGGVQVAEIK